jgi:hypothetical protein
MTPVLDEQALRTPGFQPGVPIVLGDGQAWHFPRPSLMLQPVMKEDGSVAFDQYRHSYETRCDELVDELFAATNFFDEANATLALAVHALRRNYQLDAQAVRTLFAYRTEDEAHKAMWESIRDVVLGRSPKPIASGSES